jgi:hypothetical protein
MPTVSAGLDLSTADTSSLRPAMTVKISLQAENLVGQQSLELRSAQLKPNLDVKAFLLSYDPPQAGIQYFIP